MLSLIQPHERLRDFPNFTIIASSNPATFHEAETIKIFSCILLCFKEYQIFGKICQCVKFKGCDLRQNLTVFFLLSKHQAAILEWPHKPQIRIFRHFSFCHPVCCPQHCIVKVLKKANTQRSDYVVRGWQNYFQRVLIDKIAFSYIHMEKENLHPNYILVHSI